VAGPGPARLSRRRPVRQARHLKVLVGTLIPTIRLDPAYIGILVALLGTTISPYLFFWQASQEVEQEISIGRRHLRQRQGASRFELSTPSGTRLRGCFSEVVAYFITSPPAPPTVVAGKTDIARRPDAAQALRPLAGDASRAFCSPSGSSGPACWPCRSSRARQAYGVSERSAGGRARSQDQPSAQFYVVIIAATLVGMVMRDP